MPDARAAPTIGSRGGRPVGPNFMACDLPPNFHPTTIRVLGLVTRFGTGVATGGRQSWLRCAAAPADAVRLAARATAVRSPSAECGQLVLKSTAAITP
jgi:hypothetical protein